MEEMTDHVKHKNCISGLRFGCYYFSTLETITCALVNTEVNFHILSIHIADLCVYSNPCFRESHEGGVVLFQMFFQLSLQEKTGLFRTDHQPSQAFYFSNKGKIVHEAT